MAVTGYGWKICCLPWVCYLIYSLNSQWCENWIIQLWRKIPEQTNKKQFTAPSSTSLWNDVSSSETAVPPSELPIKCSCELGCFCFWRKGPDWEPVDIYGWGSPRSLLSGFKSRFKHGAPSCVELRTQRKAWFDSISVMHAGFLAAMCTSITSQRRAALQYQRRAFVNRTREVRIRGSGLGSRSGCRGEVSGDGGGVQDKKILQGFKG